MRVVLAIMFLALFISAGSALGEDIPPPFGFRWNDPAGKVEQVLTAAKARIVNRETKEKREVWTVEGLVQPGLKRTLFEFKEGFLVEVELHYEYDKWTIENYNRSEERRVGKECRSRWSPN